MGQKSLHKILSAFKRTTSGRHPASPGIDATKQMPHPKKPQDIPHIRADSMREVNFVLEKSRKDDLAKLGSHAEWATKTLTYKDGNKTKEHSAHINWLANNINQFNPEEHKNKIEHFASMYHLPAIKNTNLAGKNLEEGLAALGQSERASISPGKKEAPNEGQAVLNTSTGKHWRDLGVSYSRAEGNAGGHCGNEPSISQGREHERILSLRTPIKGMDNKSKWHATFIDNDGYITEAKGFANTKPGKDLHRDIVELFESGRLKGYVGGGYAAGSNFHPDDVEHGELKQKIDHLHQKCFFSPDVSDLHDTIKKDKFLSFEVTDKNKKTNALRRDPEDILRDGTTAENYDLASTSTDPKVQLALLAKFPSYPYILEKLVRSPHLEVQKAMINNSSENSDNLAPYYAETIASLTKHPEIQKQILDTGLLPHHKALSKNPNLHHEVEKYLWDKNIAKKDTSPAHRLPNQVLLELALNSKNPDIQKSITDAYYKRGGMYEETLFEEMLKNKNIAPEVEQKIFSHIYGDSDTRDAHYRKLADNASPFTQKKLLETYAPDYVDKETFEKKNVYATFFERDDADGQQFLKHRRAISTLTALAERRNLDPDVEKRLADLDGKIVGERAPSDIHLALSRHALDRSPETLLSLIEKNKGANFSNVLLNMAQKCTEKNQKGEERSLPHSVQLELAKSPFSSRTIASRSTNNDILMFLANTRAYDKELANRKEWSPDLENYLSTRIDNPEVINNLALRSRSPGVQSKILDNSDEDTKKHLFDNVNLHETLEPHAEKYHKDIINKANENAVNHQENGEDLDGDLMDEAHHSAEAILQLRKKRLIRKLSDPNTDISFVKRYEFSHNDDVSKAAKERLGSNKK